MLRGSEWWCRLPVFQPAHHREAGSSRRFHTGTVHSPPSPGAGHCLWANPRRDSLRPPVEEASSPQFYVWSVVASRRSRIGSPNDNEARRGSRLTAGHRNADDLQRSHFELFARFVTRRAVLDDSYWATARRDGGSDGVTQTAYERCGA